MHFIYLVIYLPKLLFMKAFAIIGIVVSVLFPILVAIGLNEIYCSSSYSDPYSYSYIMGDGVEITLLISVLTSLFFLSFSIVALVFANRKKSSQAI